MKPLAHGALRVAKLPEMERLGDREFVLNWIGQARRHTEDPTRYQVFTRFAAPTGNARCDTWISLDRFPFLILGSRWRRGVMVGKSLGARTFTVSADREPLWRDVSIIEGHDRLSFGLSYPLAFDRPAAPVLELRSRSGEILYAPLSEILRAHYFSVPRALPSLLGGQTLFETLAAQKLQAWHYPGTCWLDKSAGVAAIERARFITEYQARCLARLIFSNVGVQNLTRLKKWIDSEFQVHPFHKPAEERADLPRLGLPYSTARWSVVAQRLASGPTGEIRYLILQILGFDADEPYQQLIITTHGGATSHGTQDDEGVQTFGKRLDPLTGEELNLGDELADPSLTPVAIEDVLPLDIASKRRKPVRNAENERSGGSAGKSRNGCGRVTSGSTREAGARGKGNAPVHLEPSTEEWPVRTKPLRQLNDALRQALDPYLQAHRDLGVEASITSLPSEHQAFAFEFRDADARTASRTRQFLTIRVTIAWRHAYVFDAERLLGSEAFPLAVLVRRGDNAFGDFSTEQIELVAKIFDLERRSGRSWVAAAELVKAFTVRAVRHPPQVETTQRELDAFLLRIVGAILALIGDVRVLA